MTIVLWTLIAVCFLAAFAGLVYPVIPSAPLLVIGFLIYGFGFSFTELTISFWIIQAVFIVLLFTLDYLVSSYTVDRRGGSQAAKIATTVGLITGPFIIPGIGLLIFPFVFAILTEKIISKKTWKDSVSIGIGTVLGILSSALLKGIAMLLMIVVFIMYVV
ncbi:MULTISPECIES: DUF456 domain-containing protein [Exiguobacterium]|uniref:DUF456 family protein n=1 Tax=Exiguobacterium antarcticum TaxID=132920 RepID=A0ABT6R3X9_9BACL|nr:MULTISPECIES: DUF456 family protein [Exiguobacterium]AFS69662.1 Hypothetical protein Eab7_0508 [Exiguobacterium antarcticum B7]MCT4780887.1 DUF456 family protein [Exiguobacterium soli]MDI3235001.1 DUF456 family protein [Exiguobacterium antarcticum]OIN66292.1 hypothetical protein BLD48_12105 [Exiguobacterium sp. KRL4]